MAPSAEPSTFITTSSSPNKHRVSSSLASTAYSQHKSLFFSLLPREVRDLIYLELWNTSSLRQHVTTDKTHISAYPTPPPESSESQAKEISWRHVPCQTNPTAEDVRFDSFRDSRSGSREEAVWLIRLRSEWCLHWACEESTPQWTNTPRAALLQRLAGEEEENGSGSVVAQNVYLNSETWGTARPTGFMNSLLACKRMYLESLPSLYANTTFVFTDIGEAGSFLSIYGNQRDEHGRELYPIRSLEICIRTTQLMTELYYPAAELGANDDGPPASFGDHSHPGLSIDNNPWKVLCDRLVELPNLQSLRIWFDTRDLREWHKRVSETRFFAKLFDVRVGQKERFVLALPSLPVVERRTLPVHHFLEGETLEDAPFVVVRGPRPNNWRVHLMASGLRGSG
ncbi:hypothetical protein QBC38DRAFT_150927 [Podospora fimiseda]|uniref:DUF7730 domain-containing protein n=1 Tax=Podospora fimiseda TaxID=252190 RepID=A0AAN7H1D8_9PEZI|nr:hypothetical protein QBC38DRAFT_150927 [Podospora fimiseda]